MLCQFSFENYKSFKDEATLDLYSENLSEHKESLIKDQYDGETFLPVAVIYGPNGGGKSTVLEAMYYLFFTVVKQVIAFNMNDGRILAKNAQFMQPRFHKFDEKCKDLPSKFDISFRIKDKMFRYNLAVKENKVVEENLYYKKINSTEAETIFERESGNIELGEIIKGTVVANKINENMPFISHIAINYNIDLINDIIDWFLNSSIVNFDNPTNELQLMLPAEEDKEKFYSILHEMGINIHSTRVLKDADGKIIDIKMKHNLENCKSAEISYMEESAGTRKILGFLSVIMSAIKQGRLIAVDELDAKLHPKLLEYIIKLFTNPKTNKNGAQLILTSHDMTTMNADVFRRDEIWFCALNPNNASHLYSLSDLRKKRRLKSKKGRSLRQTIH